MITKTIYNAKYPGCPYKSLSPSPPIIHLGLLQKRSEGCHAKPKQIKRYLTFTKQTKRRTRILWFLHLTYALTLQLCLANCFNMYFWKNYVFIPYIPIHWLKLFFLIFYKACSGPKMIHANSIKSQSLIVIQAPSHV